MLYRRYWGHGDFVGMTPRKYAYVPFNQTGKTIPKDVEHEADKVWIKSRGLGPNPEQQFVMVSMNHFKQKMLEKQKSIAGTFRESEHHGNYVKWRLYPKKTDYGPLDIDFDTIGVSLYNDWDDKMVNYFIEHRSLYLTKALENYSIEGFPLGIPEAK